MKPIDASEKSIEKLVTTNLQDRRVKQRQSVLVADIKVIQRILLKMKVNPRTKKLVKIIKGSCSFCGHNKSQVFTK